MQQKTARHLVRTFAITIWVLTFIITVISLNALVQWQFFTADGATLLSDTPIISGFVNMLLVIAFGTAIGFGLWQRRRWGRVLALIFAGLVILDVVVHLFYRPLNLGLSLLLLGCGMLVWLLAFRDDVRQLFR